MSGKGKVYIAACGIGLGHIGRVVAVADILRQEGVECVFSTYGPAYDYITGNGYKAYDSPMLMWTEKPDGSIAITRSMAKTPLYIKTFGVHMDQERQRLLKEKPDVVLSDSRYSTVFATAHWTAPHYFMANQIRFLMPRWRERMWLQWASDRISFANYHWLRRAEGIFVPDFPLPDTISKENMDVPPRMLSRLTFVGPLCRKKPEELPDTREIARKYGFEKGIFAYAGVSGPGCSRAPIIEALKGALMRFDRQSLIVRGEPRNKSSEWIGGKVNVRGWADDRFELLKACNIVVSRPGHTTISEIARFGKPSILIPTPTQSEQEGNARSMVENGTARMILQKDVSHATISEAVEDIVRRADEYAKSARRLQELTMKHDGARAIADKLLEHIKR